MRQRYYLLLLCLLAPGFAAAQSSVRAAACAASTAESYLHVNEVRARLLNNGGLFYRGAPHVYEVGGANAIFAAGIWLGGKVGGEVRTAGTTYGPYEFWAGPLDASGNPPTDCAPYDRIFRITQADITAYEVDGTISADLRDWPQAWGAPVVDGDGDPGNYNLAGGDRPEILGHETHWWVMNDVAGPHGTTGSAPIGMEVQVTAFGIAGAVMGDDGAVNLDQTTFYRYKLVYRGAQPLTDAYFGFFADPDLGDAFDDYVGSDTTLDMGFVYNADDFDADYGEAAPALGVTFVKTPDNGGSRMMDAFVYYNNGSGINEDPQVGADYYNYLQARWKDGRRIQEGGDGLTGTNGRPTNFMFPGDPVTGQFWSERNTNGNGQGNEPMDRRFVMSSGPFNMAPGATEEVTFAIVWARGTSHLESVSRLRASASAIRGLWTEGGFEDVSPMPLPAAGPALVAPVEGATGQPAEVVFQWAATEHASTYDVEVTNFAGTVEQAASGLTARVDYRSIGVLPGDEVYWRVRGRNASGVGPWSEYRRFVTTGAALVGIAGGAQRFLTVANANGAISPPTMGAYAFNANGFPTLDGGTAACSDEMNVATCNDRPTANQQVNGTRWGINVGGSTDGTFTTYMERSVYGRAGNAGGENFAGSDYEWRFTGESVAHRAFDSDGAQTMTVPFELWNIGSGTPDEASDDYRMIPFVCETACRGEGNNTVGVFDIGGDHPVSGAENDPLSDWVYWYHPVDRTPGTAGYDKWVAAGASFNDEVGPEALARQVLVGFNLGEMPSYTAALPEPGTVFRIVTRPAEISAPVASGPAAGAELPTTATTLIWQQAPMAGSQTAVEVALDADFTNVVRAETVTGNSLDLSGLVPGTTYFWRVRQSAGGFSPWSETASFTVSATATGIAHSDELPRELTFGTVAPHPVTAQARVRFGVPAASDVRVSVFDVLGREVEVLVDRPVEGGWHTAQLDASRLASGVYFVRVVAGGEQQVKAVVVAR